MAARAQGDVAHRDDVWIPRKDAPFKLPEDETTVKSCIEPKLRSADEINGDMLANNDAHCRIDAIDVNGAQVTGAGTCAPVDRNGIHLSGKIDIDGRQRDDRINAKFGLALIARMPQGVSRRVRAGMEVTWTRLGDCRL